MITALPRAELVFAAEEAISGGSKSFRMASRLFDRPTRERAWLLYSWCRHCDDVCDGQASGHRSDHATGTVAELETMTIQTLKGEPAGALPYQALSVVLDEVKIPARLVMDHLRGFLLDAEGWRPGTEADMLQYCYHVAGAVGCMMAVVMGVDPDDERTLACASDLGTAFQLSNIARDVFDDQLAGRCYIPAEWLEEQGLSESNLNEPERREALVGLVHRLTELAGRYETTARAGIPKLPFRARWAVLAASQIYGAIGRQVASLGSHAWDHRVVVGRPRKLAFLVSSFAQAAAMRTHV